MNYLERESSPVGTSRIRVNLLSGNQSSFNRMSGVGVALVGNQCSYIHLKKKKKKTKNKMQQNN